MSPNIICDIEILANFWNVWIR